MTVIVALKQDDHIFFGADSSCGDDSNNFGMKEPKIFFIGKEMVGYAGNIRIGQLLKLWKFPKEIVDVNKYIHHHIPMSIRQLLKGNGCLTIKKNVEEMTDTHIIFTFRDKIYLMEEDFAVWESWDKYLSIGSGSDLAMGSLYTTSKWDIPAKDRVKFALEASERYSNSVEKPFKFLEKEIVYN